MMYNLKQYNRLRHEFLSLGFVAGNLDEDELMELDEYERLIEAGDRQRDIAREEALA